MTQAIAAISPSPSQCSAEANTPLVLVDGSPDPDLSVVSVSLEAPLDHREATLQIGERLARGLVLHEQSDITLVVPHRLSDGEVRWQALLSGGLVEHERRQSAGSDDKQRIVRDRLASMLSEPIALLGPWHGDEIPLSDLLRRLSARLGADLVLACQADLTETVIVSSSPQRDTIAGRIEPALSSLGLTLLQELRIEGQRLHRSLVLVADHLGRLVSLPWPDEYGQGGSVASFVVDRETVPPRAWVAQGDQPVVEDTFLLQAGWDPGLQGQPDSDYGRLTSSDFSRYGSVYRAWVLNEDGAYSDSPFNLGSAFDVGALFDQPGTLVDPIRFRSCLARSAAGRRLSPVIESSTDSGLNWSVYPGQSEVMTDRAGVLLTDDVLPGTILSAAKAGTLRLRVTASLTSPNPIEEKRWDGNPFVGPAPTRVVDFGDPFAWRYVAPTSIHHDSIGAGLLQADTVDGRALMRAQLQAHVADQPGAQATARLDLIGAWTALRVRDRVRDVQGRGIAIDGFPSSFAKRDTHIQRIEFTFGVSNVSPRTRIQLE